MRDETGQCDGRPHRVLVSSRLGAQTDMTGEPGQHVGRLVAHARVAPRPLFTPHAGVDSRPMANGGRGSVSGTALMFGRDCLRASEQDPRCRQQAERSDRYCNRPDAVA